MHFLIRLVINAAALWVAANLVEGIYLEDRLFSILLVAFVFGLVNALIRPVVKILSIPLLLLTLGLFTVVINAMMLMLTGYLTDSLTVMGFWPALWGSVVISIVSMVMGHLLDESKAR